MKSSSFQGESGIDSALDFNYAACLDTDDEYSTNLVIDIGGVELLLDGEKDIETHKSDHLKTMKIKKTPIKHSSFEHGVGELAQEGEECVSASQDDDDDAKFTAHCRKMKLCKITKSSDERKLNKSDVYASTNEDKALLAPKRAKVEKLKTISLTTFDTASSTTISSHNVNNVKINTNAAEMSTAIEPDLLGPCDPGTAINLDGIVWLETSTGMLVVNVTWRGRTYVGTLLDSSRHEFAPPNPKTYESPMDQAVRNQRRRGRRSVDATNRNTRSNNRSYLSADNNTGNGKNNGSFPDNDFDSSLRTSSLKNTMFKCPQPNCSKRFPDVLAMKFHHNQNHSRQSTKSPEITANKSNCISVFKMPSEVSTSHSETSCNLHGTFSKHKPSTGDLENQTRHTVSCSDSLLVTCVSHGEKFSQSAKRNFCSGKPICTSLVENGKKGKKKMKKQPNSRPKFCEKSEMFIQCKSEQFEQLDDCTRKADDPASPAYSDISDGSPAPVLEKEAELCKVLLPLPTIFLPQARELDEKIVKTMPTGCVSNGYPFFSHPPNLLPIVHSDGTSLNTALCTNSSVENVPFANCFKKSSLGDSSPTENMQIQRELLIPTSLQSCSISHSELNNDQENKRKIPLEKINVNSYDEFKIFPFEGSGKNKASADKCISLASSTEPSSRPPAYTSYASSLNPTIPLSLSTSGIGWFPLPDLSLAIPSSYFDVLSDKNSAVTNVVTSANSCQHDKIFDLSSSRKNSTNLKVEDFGNDSNSLMLPSIMRYAQAHSHVRMFNDDASSVRPSILDPINMSQWNLTSNQEHTTTYDSLSHDSGTILKTHGLIPSSFLSK